MDKITTITTRSPEETIEMAVRIAKKLRQGDLIALTGELGAGKTMFVKGLAKGLGVKDHRHVNSPSFVVLKEYRGRQDLYHFDVYRLEAESFSETLDYKKYFYGEGITVIEWADKISGILPEDHLKIEIKHNSRTERQFEFYARSDRLKKIAEKVKEVKERV